MLPAGLYELARHLGDVLGHDFTDDDGDDEPIEVGDVDMNGHGLQERP